MAGSLSPVITFLSIDTIESLDVLALANAYPMLPADESAELATDITKRGVIQPIIIFENQLLDGRNRLKAVAAANESLLKQEEPTLSELPVRVFTGTIEDAEDLVISLNERRRDLKPEQRAIIADKHRTIVEARAKARMLATQNNEAGRAASTNLSELVPETVSNEKGKTSVILAEKHGVSATYIDTVKRLRKASEETMVDPDSDGRVLTPRATKAVAGLRQLEQGKATVHAVAERVFKGTDIIADTTFETSLEKQLKSFTSAKIHLTKEIKNFHKLDPSAARLGMLLGVIDDLRELVGDIYDGTRSSTDERPDHSEQLEEVDV